jgi:hypothetical protein
MDEVLYSLAILHIFRDSTPPELLMGPVFSTIEPCVRYLVYIKWINPMIQALWQDTRPLPYK